MGRKRNTFIKVTISSPEKLVEVKSPSLEFADDAEALIKKMTQDKKE